MIHVGLVHFIAAFVDSGCWLNEWFHAVSWEPKLLLTAILMYIVLRNYIVIVIYLFIFANNVVLLF